MTFRLPVRIAEVIRAESESRQLAQADLIELAVRMMVDSSSNAGQAQNPEEYDYVRWLLAALRKERRLRELVTVPVEAIGRTHAEPEKAIGPRSSTEFSVALVVDEAPLVEKLLAFMRNEAVSPGVKADILKAVEGELSYATTDFSKTGKAERKEG